MLEMCRDEAFEIAITHVTYVQHKSNVRNEDLGEVFVDESVSA